MKKYVLTILVVVSMLVMLVGTVAAAPLAAGTAALVGVQYVPGKGPVFTFSVSGKFSKADLKGSLQVEGGANFDLHCTKVDDSTVTCTASKKVAGENVALFWGGGTFWAHVPAAPEFCYSIWDWWEFTDFQWTDFGPHCQPMRAYAGTQLPTLFRILPAVLNLSRLSSLMRMSQPIVIPLFPMRDQPITTPAVRSSHEWIRRGC